MSKNNLRNVRGEHPLKTSPIVKGIVLRDARGITLQRSMVAVTRGEENGRFTKGKIMIPDSRFLNLPKNFWANVRLIGQEVGYTIRGEGIVKIPSLHEIRGAFNKIGLGTSQLADSEGNLTVLGTTLIDYFEYRAKLLNDYVEPRLMDAKEAELLYNKIKQESQPKCPLPMNKQKGEKKKPAFLTGIINMLIEKHSSVASCDYDPRVLTTITMDWQPVRTLSRRIDGAFPSAINPIAVWEIKEYYYTTTFGSRIADGVYESLLDGMELEELTINVGIEVKHYLMVDAYYTWWKCGKSYLCRIIDMMHMGYLDEVLFGKETIERLPDLVASWVKILEEKNAL